jgi:hypothetical protein
MSASLKTRALIFYGHDTSGAMSYVLYEKGKEAGRHDWEYRDDPSDKQFAELELYVPACYGRQAGKEIWLAARRPERIARTDVVEISNF